MFLITFLAIITDYFLRFESITERLVVNWLEMSMYHHLKVCLH
jgi:hypothetical protein